jgi:hypothetical protein
MSGRNAPCAARSVKHDVTAATLTVARRGGPRAAPLMSTVLLEHCGSVLSLGGLQEGPRVVAAVQSFSRPFLRDRMDDHVGIRAPPEVEPSLSRDAGALRRTAGARYVLGAARSPRIVCPSPRNPWTVGRDQGREEPPSTAPLARAASALAVGLLLLSLSRTDRPLIAWNGNCLGTGYARHEDCGPQIVAGR